jgi:hypothetical protein
MSQPIGLISVSEKDLEHATLRPVPMADLLTQHRKRFILRTAKYDIVLKYITHLDVEKSALEILKDREHMNAAQRLLQLGGKVTNGGELNAEEMTEYRGLEEYLAPSKKLFTFPCFVSPVITTLEEYDLLMSNLSKAETKELEEYLVKLSRLEPEGPVASSIPTLASIYHFPIAPDLNGENITGQQAASLAAMTRR